MTEGAVCAQSPTGAGPQAGGKHTEVLPAAEKGEAEQGQPSKYASGLRSAPHIWATATRSSAPFFASGRWPAPQKSAKRKRTMPVASGDLDKLVQMEYTVPNKLRPFRRWNAKKALSIQCGHFTILKT